MKLKNVKSAALFRAAATLIAAAALQAPNVGLAGLISSYPTTSTLNSNDEFIVESGPALPGGPGTTNKNIMADQLLTAAILDNTNANIGLGFAFITNQVNGQIYTNPYNRVLSFKIPVIVSSPLNTAGTAEIDAKITPTNTVGFSAVSSASIGFGSTGPLMTNRATLCFEVPAGWLWEVTNNIIGSGYVALFDGSKTQEVTIH